MSLKVVVGGHPNSGTSFLCNLVSEIGYSAGTNLKGADSHNRYGYWEHLGMRELIWHSMCGPAILKTFPYDSMDPPHGICERIVSLSDRDNIEVYKEVVLPFVYRAFPEDCKFIIITRDWRIIRDKYYEDVDALMFLDRYTRYHRLAQDMTQSRDVMFVRYEHFARGEGYREICRFLGKPYDPSVRKVYRP